jgi:hypothetical protein
MEPKTPARPGEGGNTTPEGGQRPGKIVRPESEMGSGGPPPEDIDDAGKTPSPATADDEMQRRGRRLEEIKGLTDNDAGG